MFQKKRNDCVKMGCTYGLLRRSAWLRAIALSLIIPASSGAQTQGPTARSGSKQRTTVAHRNIKNAAALSISRINDPNTRNSVGLHDRGDAVIRAAILLDRLKFSPGELSVDFTKNLEEAVRAFQVAYQLTPTGRIDSSTWVALNDKQKLIGTNLPAASSDQAPGQNIPAIDIYIVTLEDTAGPFTKLPVTRGRDAGGRLILSESKLKQMNFASPLELLAEKFHSSPHLLVELNPGKVFTKAGVRLQVPNVLTPGPTEVGSIVVDASSGRLNVLDPNGRVVASYPTTVGSAHDPLPIGDWKIVEVSWYPHFKYNPKLFWDADDKNPHAVLAPGPRNPVGVVWIGLSKEHYGIHGTPDPSKIGLTTSHGCIRLTNWDAAELGKIVRVGTPVVLTYGSS